MAKSGAVIIEWRGREVGAISSNAGRNVVVDIPQGSPPGTRRTDRLAWPLSFVAAAVAHAAILAALVPYQPSEHASGGGGIRLEAISVEIVPSVAIEAREVKPAELAAPAASETVAAQDGERSATDAAAQEVQPKSEEPQSTDDEKHVLAPTQTADAEPPAPADPEAEPVTASQPPAQKEPAPASVQHEGGVTARAEGNSRASAPPTASPGAMQRYAIHVRTALARNKPDGRGRRGTTTVTFAIAASGKIASAQILQSSGSRPLDEAVLNAVRGTSFPPPPDGMAPQDLTYVIPFHFK
jgi:TonB family protein